MVELAISIVSFLIVAWACLMGATLIYLLLPYALLLSGIIGLSLMDKSPSEVPTILAWGGALGMIWIAVRHWPNRA